eukprot:7778348-Karenia_brevis.AAC.1
MECPPPPPPWKPAVERGTPSNASSPPHPVNQEAEQDQQSPQGRHETKHQQLVTLKRDDWLPGPQGTMSLAEMLSAAGFEVSRGQSPETATPSAAGNIGPP